MTADIITPAQAAGIYRCLTGDRISERAIRYQVEQYPYLGVWTLTGQGYPRLTGIIRRRWDYFIRVRLATCGRANIFNTWGTDDI